MNTNEPLRFTINLTCYSLEAVYKAAYIFVDRAYIFLDSRSSKKVTVFLKGKKKLSSKKLEDLKGEFLNELLNCTLRVRVAARNKKIREMMVGQALISALGDQSGVQDESWQDDPLGIAIPWEEKYAEDSKKKQKKQSN